MVSRRNRDILQHPVDSQSQSSIKNGSQQSEDSKNDTVQQRGTSSNVVSHPISAMATAVQYHNSDCDTCCIASGTVHTTALTGISSFRSDPTDSAQYSDQFASGSSDKVNNGKVNVPQHTTTSTNSGGTGTGGTTSGSGSGGGTNTSASTGDSASQLLDHLSLSEQATFNIPTVETTITEDSLFDDLLTSSNSQIRHSFIESRRGNRIQYRRQQSSNEIIPRRRRHKHNRNKPTRRNSHTIIQHDEQQPRITDPLPVEENEVLQLDTLFDGPSISNIHPLEETTVITNENEMQTPPPPPPTTISIDTTVPIPDPTLRRRARLVALYYDDVQRTGSLTLQSPSDAIIDATERSFTRYPPSLESGASNSPSSRISARRTLASQTQGSLSPEDGVVPHSGQP